jgi:hypothetical protein
MNWVLENLIQGVLNDLEDILLKLHSKNTSLNFYRTNEPSKIWEDDLLGDSINKNLDFKEKLLSDSTKKIS